MLLKVPFGQGPQLDAVTPLLVTLVILNPEGQSSHWTALRGLT